MPDATNVDVPITMTVPNTPLTAPANPFPVNGATNQPLAFTMDWTASDPDFGQVVTYDLYFSTSQPLVNTLVRDSAGTPGRSAFRRTTRGSTDLQVVQ